MERPKINIKYETIDYIIESLGIIALVCLVTAPIYFYNSLPDNIPIHYNIHGQPDAYESKQTIWILPLIGLFLYIGMTLLNKIPHLFNYPTKVTSENAEKLYRTGTRTVILLKVISTLIFAYLNFKTISIGLSKSTELGVLFTPTIIFIIIVFPGFMIYKMTKKE